MARQPGCRCRCSGCGGGCSKHATPEIVIEMDPTEPADTLPDKVLGDYGPWLCTGCEPEGLSTIIGPTFGLPILDIPGLDTHPPRRNGCVWCIEGESVACAATNNGACYCDMNSTTTCHWDWYDCEGSADPAPSDCAWQCDLLSCDDGCSGGCHVDGGGTSEHEEGLGTCDAIAPTSCPDSIFGQCDYGGGAGVPKDDICEFTCLPADVGGQPSYCMFLYEDEEGNAILAGEASVPCYDPVTETVTTCTYYFLDEIEAPDCDLLSLSSAAWQELDVPEGTILLCSGPPGLTVTVNE